MTPCPVQAAVRARAPSAETSAMSARPSATRAPARPASPGSLPGPHPRRPLLVRESPAVYCAEPQAQGGDDGCDDEADVLETLGDEIATLAAHIHAATHRLLVLLAEFDERRGWERDGHRSCAHWLSFRTGIDLGAAREKVRAARALTALPETGAAMACGELSFSQVRALTRVATAETEADLLELARGCPTHRLERVVRAWKRGSRQDEGAWDRERRARRTLSAFPDDDGMVVVRAVLPPEVGALVMRAIDAAGDALYREEPRDATGEPERTPGQRRADALALLAERALAAGFGEVGVGHGGGNAAGFGNARPATEFGAWDEPGAEPASGRAEDSRSPAAVGGMRDLPISGTRAARYRVVLHVDQATLDEHGEPGCSELDDGLRVSPETSRRLACDAGLVRVTHAPDGSVLDVGRRTRTIPPALRRALEVRDRGCRFPGCHMRFCDAHHVRHWADGGETSLVNTVLLCAYHHTLVHEGGWRVMWDREGRPVFVDPRGGTHYDARPRSPELPARPVHALVAEHRARGIRPDGRTAGARWKHEEDIPDQIWFRALEAAG